MKMIKYEIAMQKWQKEEEIDHYSHYKVLRLAGILLSVILTLMGTLQNEIYILYLIYPHNIFIRIDDE
mgnify:CR=1 FL=1